MFIWKRRVGQSLIVGNDVLVKVNGVYDTNGDVLKGVGEIALGFDVPDGVRVQRGEKYRKSAEDNLSFPEFYRARSRRSGKPFGYAFTLPAEADRTEHGYDYEPIQGYEDMIEDDAPVEFHVFRSEAEALAFRLGMEASGKDESDVGLLHTKQGDVWLVLLHWYTYNYDEDVNPIIRDHTQANEHLLQSLQRKRSRRVA